MSSVASVPDKLSCPTDLSEEGLSLYKDALEKNGHTTVKAICLKSDIEKIRALLGAMLTTKKAIREGSLFDTLTNAADGQGNRSIQISEPSVYAPELLKTSYVKEATRIAKEFISEDCFLMADYALLKPARVGTGTPWHQDEAFRDPSFDHKEITFWMPLQDVGEAEGCMFYIPGSHQNGILSHQSPGNDHRVHALECSEDLNELAKVACPLLAGDSTIHNGRVLHKSSDNQSAIDRYAYILIFGMAPIPSSEKRHASWLSDKCTAESRTKRRWLIRGGFAVALFRRFRRRSSFTPGMLSYFVRRVFRRLRLY